VVPELGSQPSMGTCARVAMPLAWLACRGGKCRGEGGWDEFAAVTGLQATPCTFSVMHPAQHEGLCQGGQSR